MNAVLGPHLQVIRDAIAAINSYLPKDEDTFLNSPMVLDAVLMRLQVIGEHLARLRQIDSEWFAANSDESWWQIIGLRNVISHGYEIVEHREIWKMINDELPSFASGLDRLDS